MDITDVSTTNNTKEKVDNLLRDFKENQIKELMKLVQGKIHNSRIYEKYLADNFGILYVGSSIANDNSTPDSILEWIKRNSVTLPSGSNWIIGEMENDKLVLQPLTEDRLKGCIDLLCREININSLPNAYTWEYCPYCGGENVVKLGFAKNEKMGPKQRLRCSDCVKLFYEE